MNQSICFGSLAVETACPNRDQDFLFRHSTNARVTARPPTRANQPRHDARPAYGRDSFHDVPDYFVATNSRKPKSPDAHKRRRLSFSFPAFCPSPIMARAARTRPFFHKPLARISISYLHQTLDFPTRNEFLKLNFKLKGTL